MRILRPFPDTPDFFRSIGVTFVKDGVTVETVEVPFGGRIASVPSVADEDGMYWQWNDFDPNEAVDFSRTVEGEYIRPVTTISTGEDEPLFLAEGAFRDGQTLLAVPFVPDAETLGIDAASILAAYTVRVSGYSELPHRAPCLPRRPGVSIRSRKARSRPAFVHPRRQLYCFPAGQRRDRSCTLRRKPPVPAGSLAALRAALQPLRRSS